MNFTDYDDILANTRLRELPREIVEYFLEGYLCERREESVTLSDGRQYQKVEFFLLGCRHSPARIVDGAVVREPTRFVGSLKWYWRGLLHRDGDPAVIALAGFYHEYWVSSGSTCRNWHTKERLERWYCRGKLHRDDGPACSLGDWYRHGKKIPDPRLAIENSTMQAAIDFMISYPSSYQPSGARPSDGITFLD